MAPAAGYTSVWLLLLPCRPKPHLLRNGHLAVCAPHRHACCYCLRVCLQYQPASRVHTTQRGRVCSCQTCTWRKHHALWCTTYPLLPRIVMPQHTLAPSSHNTHSISAASLSTSCRRCPSLVHTHPPSTTSSITSSSRSRFSSIVFLSTCCLRICECRQQIHMLFIHPNVSVSTAAPHALSHGSKHQLAVSSTTHSTHAQLCCQSQQLQQPSVLAAPAHQAPSSGQAALAAPPPTLTTLTWLRRRLSARSSG